MTIKCDVVKEDALAIGDDGRRKRVEMTKPGLSVRLFTNIVDQQTYNIFGRFGREPDSSAMTLRKAGLTRDTLRMHRSQEVHIPHDFPPYITATDVDRSPFQMLK